MMEIRSGMLECVRASIWMLVVVASIFIVLQLVAMRFTYFSFNENMFLLRVNAFVYQLVACRNNVFVN